MTVSTSSNKASYTGNGSTTVFTFPFSTPGADSIFVFIENPDGVVTPAPNGTYNVVLNPLMDPNPTPVGGSVTYPVGGPPLPVGWTITIIRELDRVQPVSLTNQSIIYPPVVEKEFDYLTMLSQQSTEESSRAFRVPLTDPIPATVPTVALRANQQAVFDANGDLTAGGVVIGTIISPVMVPVVTATTLPLARAAMGVPPIDSPVFTGDPQAPTPPLHDNDTSIATTAYVQAELLSIGDIFTTGDMKPTHKVVADPGWIMWLDGTVGNAGSSASILAAATTQALFNLYYNFYNDSTCPLLTSAGVLTLRATEGTAAAAFAANCRMTLPRGPGRNLAVAGVGVGLTGRGVGSAFGAESIAIQVGNLPSHTHGITVDGHAHTLTLAGGDIGFLTHNDGGPQIGNAGGTNVSFGNYAVDAAFPAASASFTGSNVPLPIIPPTASVNVMIKL